MSNIVDVLKAISIIPSLFLLKVNYFYYISFQPLGCNTSLFYDDDGSNFKFSSYLKRRNFYLFKTRVFLLVVL